VNAGSPVGSSRSSECFQEVGNKEGMVKTLAKPMLHYRLLNCRASGLLEQRDAPKHVALTPGFLLVTVFTAITAQHMHQVFG
jgi:hypothetical protein